jgi:hypothetical protein
MRRVRARKSLYSKEKENIRNHERGGEAEATTTR